jgi:hypothetical protein
MSKTRIAATCALGVALVCCVALWVLPPPLQPPVRLTFLNATNDAQTGWSWGTFLLENNSSETVLAGAGMYERQSGGKWVHGIGDYGVDLGLGPRRFTAGTTNLLSLWVPDKGGPYRLVLICVPSSKTTPQYYKSVRFRLAALFLGLLQAGGSSESVLRPAYAAGRMYGTLYPASQAFRPPTLNPSLQRTPESLSKSNSVAIGSAPLS